MDAIKEKDVRVEDLLLLSDQCWFSLILWPICYTRNHRIYTKCTHVMCAAFTYVDKIVSMGHETSSFFFRVSVCAAGLSISWPLCAFRRKRQWNAMRIDIQTSRLFGHQAQ